MINPFKSKKGLGRGLSSLIGDSEVKIKNNKLSKYLSNFEDNSGMKYKKYNLEFFGLCKKCKLKQ